MLGLLASTIPVFAAGHSKEKEDKKAILLVAFGTSVKSTLPAYENIEQEVRKAFPDVEVRWAYTSDFIRKKVAKRDGITIDSPITALAKLQDEGYNLVAVQSLHIFPGQEYNDLRNIVEGFQSIKRAKGDVGLKKLVLGHPLLYAYEDYVKVVSALTNQFGEYEADDAIVLMGHGSDHYAFPAYSCLNDMLRRMCKNAFLGCVEGYPSFDELKQDLKASGVKAVRLMPFMIVAGDHAINDLAGDEDDSWKRQLIQEGYEVSVYLKGLGENNDIARIYLEHLKGALAQLEVTERRLK
ncbi:MAG: cobalt chelatase [Firmicutes bacterium]|nr:cobalt chelatase [Bacillota bacterium]